MKPQKNKPTQSQEKHGGKTNDTFRPNTSGNVTSVTPDTNLQPLSDKVKDGNWMYNGSNTEQKCFAEEDVREAVKRLQEIFVLDNTRMLSCFDIQEEIKKIFGTLADEVKDEQ